MVARRERRARRQATLLPLLPLLPLLLPLPLPRRPHSLGCLQVARAEEAAKSGTGAGSHGAHPRRARAGSSGACPGSAAAHRRSVAAWLGGSTTRPGGHGGDP